MAERMLTLVNTQSGQRVKMPPACEFREKGKIATLGCGDQRRLPGRATPFMPRASGAQRRQWLKPPMSDVHLPGARSRQGAK